MPLVPVGAAVKATVPPVREISRVAPAPRAPREAKVRAAEPPPVATDWREAWPAVGVSAPRVSVLAEAEAPS